MKDKEKHFWATDNQRRKNLDLEKPLWEKIVGNDKLQIEYYKNKYHVSFKGKKTGLLQERANSLCEKIWRVSSQEYSLKRLSLFPYIYHCLRIDKQKRENSQINLLSLFFAF